ncbi:AraC family transcriptional regulator [Flavobacterium sp.]|uniref:helix-turn-helix domain-containing protein n=1 Tax=Flavobacterium sp. TaxID=239 RepID=UPI00286BCF6B|nr:AraC family transcriptional regulator [Flavobacterium sp.]
MIVAYNKPKNPILQKYIEGYYFLTNTSGELENSYLTFPNNYCIVTITNKCDIKFEKEKVVLREDNSQTCLSTIISNYKKPIQIAYFGNIKELTVIFKPLGINHFLENKLMSYLNDSFEIFEPFPDYLQTKKIILSIEDIDKAKEVLENYWLSKLIPFDNSFLQTAINLLEDYEKNYTIQQVADNCMTSRQNLSKKFFAHLGKTPSDYKKINRFRNALNHFEEQKNIKNLSSLLLDSTFYDQSHFIKDFKSLTGKAPKDFFKNLDCTVGGDIKWSWT